MWKFQWNFHAKKISWNFTSLRENDGREIDGPMCRAWNCRTWKWRTTWQDMKMQMKSGERLRLNRLSRFNICFSAAYSDSKNIKDWSRVGLICRLEHTPVWNRMHSIYYDIYYGVLGLKICTLLKFCLFSCNFAPFRHFCPVFSCPAISCLAISCPAISCHANWFVIFTSCNFTPCTLVSQFHVLQFHALQFWWSVIFMSVIFSQPVCELGRGHD